jgi:RHS repeat-associated protein
VTAITGPDGSRTEFGYDEAFRLTEVTRAGLTWRYGYDPAGRLVAATDANGASTEYSYDPAGQLTGRVNAAGQAAAFGYDDLGNLTTSEAGEVVTTFGYDPAGRLMLACNPDAQLRLSRDPRGRVTAETCNDRTVISEYDGAGRRSRRLTPGGAHQRWEYDESGRPVLLEASGHLLRFGYDRAGRQIRRELPGGLALSQDRDAAGLLAAQVLAAPDGRVLARRAYTYTAAGLLTGIDDLTAGPRRYTLDPAGWITAVRGPGWAEQYSYDPAGRVCHARWIEPPPDVRDSWLEADVQGPRARSGTLVTAAGTLRYAHDKQGRVISRQRAHLPGEPATWTYQWDAEDRLTAVTTPDGSTWRYRYDPLGRRIAKQRLDSSGTLSQETTFTWDGAVLAEELTWRTARHGRASWECVTWDYQPGTGIPLIQFERAFSDGDSQVARGQRFYAVVTDQLGTPAELVCADGAVSGIGQHTVPGGTLWHPGGVSTPLRSPGHYHDCETGLRYHQQRYYDPVTGDYLTPEPPRITRGTYWGSGYPASFCRATARRDNIALRFPSAIGRNIAFVGGAQGAVTRSADPAAGGPG